MDRSSAYHRPTMREYDDLLRSHRHGRLKTMFCNYQYEYPANWFGEQQLR